MSCANRVSVLGIPKKAKGEEIATVVYFPRKDGPADEREWLRVCVCIPHLLNNS